MISDNQQGVSLQTSTQHQSTYNNLQNILYTMPHISHSRRTSTDTNATMSSTNTQQEYNRQSYRVPHYYSDSHSYSVEEEWEDKTHITITKIENILVRMVDNKDIKQISRGYSLWTMIMDMYI